MCRWETIRRTSLANYRQQLLHTAVLLAHNNCCAFDVLAELELVEEMRLDGIPMFDRAHFLLARRAERRDLPCVFEEHLCLMQEIEEFAGRWDSWQTCLSTMTCRVRHALPLWCPACLRCRAAAACALFIQGENAVSRLRKGQLFPPFAPLMKATTLYRSKSAKGEKPV